MSNLPYFNQNFDDGAYLASFSDFLDTYQVWIPSGWTDDYLGYHSVTNRDLMETKVYDTWKTTGQYSFWMRFNSGTTWVTTEDQMVFNFPNLELPADACWLTVDYNVLDSSSNFELTYGVQDTIFSTNGGGTISCSSTGSGTSTASSATFKDTNAGLGFIMNLTPTSNTSNDCTIAIDNIGTVEAVSDNTSTELNTTNTYVETSIDTRVAASNFNATAETVTLTIRPPWSASSTAYDDLSSGTIHMTHTFSSGNVMHYTFDYAVSEFDGDVWCDVDDHDAWVETKVHYLSPSGNDSNSGLTKYDPYRTFDYLANNIADGEYAYINYGGYNDEPATNPDVFPLNVGTSGITYEFSDLYDDGMEQKCYVGRPSKFLREHGYSTFGQYFVTYVSGLRYCVGMDTTYNDIVTTTWDTFSSDKGVIVYMDSSPDNMSVYAGTSIIMENGYHLDIVEITDTPSRSAYVKLYDGATELDDEIVAEYGRYTYVDTSHPTGEDIPIVSVQFDDFLISTEVTVAFVVGIWQCADWSTSW